MDRLMAAKANENWDNLKGFLDEAAANNGSATTNGKVFSADSNGEAEEGSETTPTLVEVDTRRSELISPDIDRPLPPFWGSQVLAGTDISWEEVFSYIDRQALFAGQWQIRKPREQSKEEFEAFIQTQIEPVLTHWQTRIIEDNLLQPQIAYGYFPCQAEGNTVIVYRPSAFAKLRPESNGSTLYRAETAHLRPSPVEAVAEAEWVRFALPRQQTQRRLCIADFYAPKEQELVDVLPLQAVTVGEAASLYSQKLFAEDKYTDYLYFYGLTNALAEALAEWAHARIRRELGFGAEDSSDIRDILHQSYRGSRYSFGYPACPHIPDQRLLLDLVGGDRIGLTMDESDQLDPEQSTTALVAYHPQAKYFNA
jgi:5-methyltetrahydrofolate--homocysteine methyltransferase